MCCCFCEKRATTWQEQNPLLAPFLLQFLLPFLFLLLVTEPGELGYFAWSTASRKGWDAEVCSKKGFYSKCSQIRRGEKSQIRLSGDEECSSREGWRGSELYRGLPELGWPADTGNVKEVDCRGGGCEKRCRESGRGRNLGGLRFLERGIWHIKIGDVGRVGESNAYDLGHLWEKYLSGKEGCILSHTTE